MAPARWFCKIKWVKQLGNTGSRFKSLGPCYINVQDRALSVAPVPGSGVSAHGALGLPPGLAVLKNCGFSAYGVLG
jgi:hypothetical protein